jgi:hypothetical protein
VRVPSDRRGAGRLFDGAVVSGVHVSAITTREDTVPLRSLFHLSFDKNDHSLYVRPIAPTGVYLTGEGEIPPGAAEQVAQFGARGAVPLKLSIHESGQVHVKEDAGGRRMVAGPVLGPPLGKLRDAHVFTVTVDSFDILADMDHEPSRVPPEVDFGFPFFEARAGRVAVWVNAVEPRFVDTTLAATITLDRGDGRVLYVGMAGVPQEPMGDSPRGLTAIAGWDALTASDSQAAQPFLFVRGE